MASDDEVENLPDYVSDYYFVDEEDEPISFSVLPFQWSSDEILGDKGKKVFVHGTTDDGLQNIYKLVTAWKFDLSRMNPEISVLSKDNHWIKLQKPKKSFEGIIRTALITVNCLHLMKKTPEMSDKLMWEKLSKIFSLLEPRPSMNDLIDHMKLIEETFRRDQSVSKSKFIAKFLEKRPEKKKAVEEDGPQKSMKGFIIDDDDALDDDSDEDDQLFDSVCAICDNGGRIISCDGICMRSFHTTPEDAIKDAEEDGIEGVSICASLGYSKKEIRAKATFTCKNCIHKQHQCFSCGCLGFSDKSSGVAEVFQCVSAACGYFYHPVCVAKLLHPQDETAAEELAKNIAAGVPFACPSHNCYVCKQLENHMVHALQFAVCRRCPTSYHRKCLPRDISFENTEDIEQRAWENLLHINNRILIYCLKHKIDADLGTPIRNHLKFPGEAKQKLPPAVSLKKNKLESKKNSLVPEKKKLKQVGPDTSIGKSLNLVQEGRTAEKNDRRSLVPSKRKADGPDASKQPVKKLATKKKTVRSSLDVENKQSLGKQLWEKCYKQFESASSGKLVSEGESGKAAKPVPEQSVCSADELDPDSKRRIENLIKEAESSVTLESVYEKYNKLLSTHAQSQKTMLDSFTQGRVEDLVKAIHFALEMLEGGRNVQEAKAVCPPHSLKQTVKWKNKLKVYIAPFLYGLRYTSFGRHFTKVDKLKEIVDKIHWYVEDGDTVVDFCCGANDFSCLMKDKLEQTGKKCSYRNFDLFQPKNDFYFERRDWMTVKPNELPNGSKLVMGLNPPFGVNASLANKFIDKALEFKPKLIVLIVPPVTERLDKKKPPYDLVWEDAEKLSGRSFYLPGSIDVNDKPIEDWNVIPPVLYLWSRSDWTAKFREISEKHDHISGKQGSVQRNLETAASSQLIEASAQISGMEINDDPQEPVQEKKLHELIEDVVESIQVGVEEHSSIHEESRETHSSGSAEAAKKSDKEEATKKSSKEKLRRKTILIPGKHESRPLGNDQQRHERRNDQQRHGRRNDQQRHERRNDKQRYERKKDQQRPSPVQPYSIPANDTVLNRSPLEDQSLLMREITPINQFDRPGFCDPSYQHRPAYRVGPSSYPEDRFPRRNQWENTSRHHHQMSGQYYGNMREQFGQQPFNSEMEPSYDRRMTAQPELASAYGHAPMSAMDRYAPRLDELNYGRRGNMGPPCDLPRHGHNPMYNHQQQTPGPPLAYGGGPQPPNVWFAPGPRLPPTSYQRSGGWLNE